MEKDEIKDLRDYAWKYFSLHADQRIKTFNFYVILATFAVGGMLTAVKDSAPPWAIAIVGAILAALSFVFWKLDVRNKELVNHGEAALKRLEQESGYEDENSEPHVFNILIKEEHNTDTKKSEAKGDWPKCYMTYSDCFFAVFRLFGFGGAIVFAIAIYFQIRAFFKP